MRFGLVLVWLVGTTLVQAAQEVRLDPSLLRDRYQVKEPGPLGPETAISREYYRLLENYLRYTQPRMRDWPACAGVKFHKRDGSKEHDVRQNATVALAYAVLSRYGEFDSERSGATREEVRSNGVALVHYLAVTHLANSLPTGDGKPWGDHWQSAFWAGIAGQAAWLMWPELPEDVRVMAARMIEHEADRFNERLPDNGEWRDTKAEENAWNSEVIALAANMFPTHPHSDLWRERAIVYMLNAFSTHSDNTNATLVDGKPLRERVSTVCIHDDFTLENHNRVHPDYLSTFTLNLRNAIDYKLAGQPVPEATFHHVREVLDVFKHLAAVNGSLFYINGQDWWPHRHDVPLMAGGLPGLLMRDRAAAFLERAALDSLKKLHARFPDGRAFHDSEVNYPNAEEELMARYAEQYLAHRLFGPAPRALSKRAFLEAQAGTRAFDIGGFVTHRTPDKFVSFAWKSGTMGLVYPADNTWLIAPNERGLIGRILVEGAKDTPPKVETNRLQRLSGRRRGEPDGFVWVGRFSRTEGKVNQRVALLSLPGQPVIYVESLTAAARCTLTEVATGLIGVLNEDAPPLARNARQVWTSQGSHRMTGVADRETKRHIWETSWANLDDSLAISKEGNGKMAYTENHTFRRARLEQEFVANFIRDPGTREAGQTISQVVLGMLPNANHRKQPELQAQWVNEDVVLVEFEGARVTVNLGEGPVTIPTRGGTKRLEALSALWK